MMELGWESSLLCLNAQDLDAAQVADAVYARVCRTDFDAPGCCLINLGSRVTSQDGRQFMVHLTASLSEVHHARAGDSLSVLSAARFDQQVTTKPHLDGGPEQCLLVLGYEPTEVSAELRIFDYAKCAIELGQTPAVFM